MKITNLTILKVEDWDLIKINLTEIVLFVFNMFENTHTAIKVTFYCVTKSYLITISGVCFSIEFSTIYEGSPRSTRLNKENQKFGKKSFST